MKFVLAAIALVGLASVTAGLPGPLDSVGTGPEQLPAPRHGTCAVTDGEYGYVFGGQQSSGNSRAEVYRHDPVSRAVERASPDLPAARHMCSAVWYNGSAYIFAGYDYANRNDILRWTPGGAAVKTGTLIAEASHQAAVVDPATGRAYVIGGYANGSLLARIQAVDLKGGNQTPVVELTTMPPRGGAAAVWDPRPLPLGECLAGCAYIVGGHNGTDYTTTILRFDPMTDQVTETPAHVEPGRLRHAAVFDGTSIHVYGGDTATGLRTNITVQVEPMLGLSNPETPLPTAVSHISAAWINHEAFLYGGSDDAGRFRSDVTWHKPIGASLSR